MRGCGSCGLASLHALYVLLSLLKIVLDAFNVAIQILKTTLQLQNFCLLELFKLLDFSQVSHYFNYLKRMEKDQKLMPNRVLFYTGRSRILCCGKCICGGTPIGIFVSLIILNLPLGLLICFNVIKTSQVTNNDSLLFDLL